MMPGDGEMSEPIERAPRGISCQIVFGFAILGLNCVADVATLAPQSLLPLTVRGRLA